MVISAMKEKQSRKGGEGIGGVAILIYWFAKFSLTKGLNKHLKEIREWILWSMREKKSTAYDWMFESL